MLQINNNISRINFSSACYVQQKGVFRLSYAIYQMLDEKLRRQDDLKIRAIKHKDTYLVTISVNGSILKGASVVKCNLPYKEVNFHLEHGTLYPDLFN